MGNLPRERATVIWRPDLENLLSHFPEESEPIVFSTTLQGIRYTLLRHRDGAQPSLSRRETEIVERVAAGKPNKVIAGELEISQHTVATYLRRIFLKLEVNSRAAMIAAMALRVQTRRRPD